jgi:hypothetical protein
MRIIRPALITVLAICFAVSGAFARESKTSTPSKSSDSSASKKKKSSANARSGKKSAKARSTAKRSSRAENLDGLLDVPPEELPVPEDAEPEAP